MAPSGHWTADIRVESTQRLETSIRRSCGEHSSDWALSLRGGSEQRAGRFEQNGFGVATHGPRRTPLEASQGADCPYGKVLGRQTDQALIAAIDGPNAIRTFAENEIA